MRWAWVGGWWWWPRLCCPSQHKYSTKVLRVVCSFRGDAVAVATFRIASVHEALLLVRASTCNSACSYWVCGAGRFTASAVTGQQYHRNALIRVVGVTAAAAVAAEAETVCSSSTSAPAAAATATTAPAPPAAAAAAATATAAEAAYSSSAAAPAAPQQQQQQQQRQ